MRSMVLDCCFFFQCDDDHIGLHVPTHSCPARCSSDLYVPSTVASKAIGSLLLGYHDAKGNLIHVGRVGTGYTVRVAEDLYRRLEKIRTSSSPFAKKLSAEQARQVRYVKPELVAEVEFRGWTADGKIGRAHV